MATDRLARIAAARHAPALGGALLALAGCGQAAAQAAGLAGDQPPAAVAVQYALPLCVFALLATVPLAVRGAAGAATAAAGVAVTAGNTASLAAFGTATAAGIAAQLIAGCRLGRLDVARGPGGRPPGGAGRVSPAGRVSLAVPALAAGLAVPFAALALASHGSVAAVLLTWAAPAGGAAGIAARARREARTRTAAGEALADTLSEHTARGERARIARELHDVVAHHISMVAVQAETARLTTPGLPAAGAQRLTEIGDTARAGLTEMRRLLGVLRDDAEEAGAAVGDRHPQPGLPQLAGLIDAAREASGAGARLIVSGPVTEFDPGVELAAYRIVQEALTNVRRHAPGAAVDVELRYRDDALHLRIRDNGPGPAPRPAADGEAADGAAADGAGHGAAGHGAAGHGAASQGAACHGAASGRSAAGHGLAGMRERALAVGGSLRTGAAPGGGFLVAADLPAKPETA